MPKKVKSPTGKKSPLSSGGKKMMKGDFSGGTRPTKPPKPKIKIKKKPRLKTFRDRRMDKIIRGEK